MTIGDLRQTLSKLDNELHIIIAVPIIDADGDEVEAWFALRTITREMDPDTTEFHARFACDRLDDFLPE